MSHLISLLFLRMFALPHSVLSVCFGLSSVHLSKLSHPLHAHTHTHTLFICCISKSSSRKSKSALGETTAPMHAVVPKLACDLVSEGLSGSEPFSHILSQCWWPWVRVWGTLAARRSSLPHVSLAWESPGSEKEPLWWALRETEEPSFSRALVEFLTLVFSPKNKLNTGNFSSPCAMLQKGSLWVVSLKRLFRMALHLSDFRRKS